MSKLQG